MSRFFLMNKLYDLNFLSVGPHVFINAKSISSYNSSVCPDEDDSEGTEWILEFWRKQARPGGQPKTGGCGGPLMAQLCGRVVNGS